MFKYIITILQGDSLSGRIDIEGWIVGDYLDGLAAALLLVGGGALLAGHRPAVVTAACSTHFISPLTYWGGGGGAVRLPFLVFFALFSKNL